MEDFLPLSIYLFCGGLFGFWWMVEDEDPGALRYVGLVLFWIVLIPAEKLYGRYFISRRFKKAVRDVKPVMDGWRKRGNHMQDKSNQKRQRHK